MLVHVDVGVFQSGYSIDMLVGAVTTAPWGWEARASAARARGQSSAHVLALLMLSPPIAGIAL
jgi:hypothetical protein